MVLGSDLDVEQLETEIAQTLYVNIGLFCPPLIFVLKLRYYSYKRKINTEQGGECGLNVSH